VEEATILSHMSTALAIFMTLVLPPLGAALVAGLVVGIVQAATQIQDQTLPLTIKLFVVIAVLGLFSAPLASPLLEHGRRVFDEFPGLTSR
jgi:type III secretion protein S